MEKMLVTGDYMLMLSGQDMLMYINGREPSFYQGEVEAFARGALSNDALRNHKHDRDIKRVKDWIFAVLYHERNKSIPEIIDITGYNSASCIFGAVVKYGPSRSCKEATNSAVLKKYGLSTSQFSSRRMKESWRIRKLPNPRCELP